MDSEINKSPATVMLGVTPRLLQTAPERMIPTQMMGKTILTRNSSTTPRAANA